LNVAAKALNIIALIAAGAFFVFHKW